MKILFTGGGSGGHIVPIIAIVREIRKIYSKKDLEISYLGPRDIFGSILLSQEGIAVKTVLAGKIRRYLSWKSFLENLLDIFFKTPAGICQALFYIFFLSPDLIFSKGGFGSIPAVMAAKFFFVPVFLHESDIVPGLANKFISGLAKKIFVSFPKTEYFPLKKMILVGNPIRREILESSKEEARDFFKLFSEKPVILILGGSQGAQRINDKILQILHQLLENFELLHQAGENNFKAIKAEAKVIITEELEKSYHLFAFLKEPELKLAYGAADLIISRAGSGTIFEIAALAKPSILIPLPESAQNHQIKNAYAYQGAGACLVLEEANFTPYFFLERVKSLFANSKDLQKMSQAAKNFAKPESAKVIANYLVNFI